MLDLLDKRTLGTLYAFVEKRDKDQLAYRFSLKDGSIFFAACGLLWWSSELVLDRSRCLTLLVGESRLKMLYALIVILYISCLFVLIVTLNMSTATFYNRYN